MRRKDGLKIIIFLVIFVLLLTGISYIVRTNGDVKNRFAGFYAQKDNSIDVLLMGASPIGSSLSPGYMWGTYGFTSYPLSSNTQSPHAIKYLLEEGYKYQNPDVVVIELRMFTYDTEVLKNDIPHIREVTDNMKYSLQRLKTINALVQTDAEPLYSYYFDIFKFHSNWKMLFLPEELKKYRYCLEDVDKGFEHPTTIMMHDTPPDLSTDETMPIPIEQEECLYDLLAFLKEHNQPALFFVSPRYSYLEYEMQMNYMKEIIEKEGFQYVNLNECYDELSFEFATDLMDGAHTNTLGAKKCSDYIGSYLVEQYDLKDKRKDEAYKSWNKSYESFNYYYNEIYKQSLDLQED